MIIGKLLWTKTADRKKILGEQEQLESLGPSEGLCLGEMFILWIRGKKMGIKGRVRVWAFL